MQKYKKIILIVLAAVLLAAVGIGLFAAGPVLAMRPAKTGGIPGAGSIYAIKNGVGSVYLFDTGSGCVLIDAGSNAAKLEQSMEEKGIEAENIKWILLTHSDYDHIAGLTLFPNAEIYMGEDEFYALGLPPRQNQLPEGLSPDKFYLLTDEDELWLHATPVRCIKAPGHTAGSMAYMIDGKYLFTGDAIRLGKAAIVHPFTQDKAQAEETIEQLMALPWYMILTSHYGITTK